MSAKKHNRKHDKDRDVELQVPDPERLHDINHRMNHQTNDVQGEVSYDENTRQGNQDTHLRKETMWRSVNAARENDLPNDPDEDLDYKSDEFDNMTDGNPKHTNRNSKDGTNEIKDWKNTI